MSELYESVLYIIMEPSAALRVRFYCSHIQPAPPHLAQSCCFTVQAQPDLRRPHCLPIRRHCPCLHLLHNYTALHNKRLTDCVSTHWPRSSASALLSIAEVLESHCTIQAPSAFRRSLAHSLLASEPAFWSCLAYHRSQPPLSDHTDHSHVTFHLSLLLSLPHCAVHSGLLLHNLASEGCHRSHFLLSAVGSSSH